MNGPDQNYLELGRGAIERGILTNSGPLSDQLESALEEYLGCSNVVLASSGTSALQIAIRTLGLKGKIITTPFTYIATANAIAWIGLEPVFIDISEDDLGLNPTELENALDQGISAVLPVHALGYPCNIDAIESIADSAGIPTIYDAAACFGTRFRERSIVGYGDISVLSFHTSKIFSTIEGGAIILHDESLYERARTLVHNGCSRDRIPVELGMNAKLSELHAAFGLSRLPTVDDTIKERLARIRMLRENLSSHAGVRFINEKAEVAPNAAYCPMVFENEGHTLRTLSALRELGIECRRYFYPALNTLPFFRSKSKTPVAEDISRRILCLNFATWNNSQVSQISEAITACRYSRLTKREHQQL